MLWHGVMFMTLTCVVATIGYRLCGWSWIDASYMVTITIFGVGYGEVRPIDTPAMKLFTTGVIFAGCSSLIYVVGGVVQMITEGEVTRLMGQTKNRRQLDKLSDHTIVCGFGRVGATLAADLRDRGETAVVLDLEESRIAAAEAAGFLALVGDAADEAVLHGVGLLRAKTLVTALPNDAMNVFITLTARDNCAGVRIIARAEAESTERKLLLGGADHVVMPTAIGAMRMAELATADAPSTDLPEERLRVLGGTGEEDRLLAGARQLGRLATAVQSSDPLEPHEKIAER